MLPSILSSSISHAIKQHRYYLLGRVVVLVVEVSAEGHVHRKVRPRQLLHPLADLPLLLLRLVHLVSLIQ